MELFFGHYMKLITQSLTVETMTTREIAELVGKQHSNIKISAERLSGTGVIGTLAMQGFMHNGNVYHEYLITKRDSLILVAQNCPEFTAKIIDRWQELEAAQVSALPNFNNPAEAARAWAFEYDAKIQAQATKAQIGNKREATAMNTASQAAKKAKKLEIQLDQSSTYATVKRMTMHHRGINFNWRVLKRAADALSLPAMDVFDANYGTVKAYHARVWQDAYSIDIPIINIGI